MAYYHVVIEARENLGKHDEPRTLTIFDCTDIKSIVPTVIQPYLNKQTIDIDGEPIQFQDIDLFKIYHTTMPIQRLVETEQSELPSHTDITISAFEVFNNYQLCQDITQVVLELVE